MSTVRVNEEIKSAEIQAVITRADGTVEDLGTVSYYHKNPLKRLQFRIKELLKNGNRPS